MRERSWKPCLLFVLLDFALARSISLEQKFLSHESSATTGNTDEEITEGDNFAINFENEASFDEAFTSLYYCCKLYGTKQKLLHGSGVRNRALHGPE
jgi:hypothetical protein